MATRITEFLTRYIDRPMTWGADDCSLLIADWWIECHGIDPAAHLRGTYATLREKNLIVKRAGGLLLLVSDIAFKAGATHSAHLHDGDFAVLSANGGKRLCGIYNAGFWACRAKDGIAFSSDMEVIRAWAI